MFIGEMVSGCDHITTEHIGDGWYKMMFVFGGRPRTLYLHSLKIPEGINIPCCGRTLEAPWLGETFFCVLPPGHQHADVPCVSSRARNYRVVQVSDRHPHLEISHEAAWEEVLEEATVVD